MTHAYDIEVIGLDASDTIPGRFATSGMIELIEALDGYVDDDEDVWAAMARTFEALPFQELAERLLDLVLLKPPIPAGCEALVRAMQDPSTAPWRTHELAEDRVWLWYCHRLLHGAMPDRFPAPLVTRVQVRVSSTDPVSRPPGKRTPAHDRTAFLAGLLGRREGDNPIAQVVDTGEAWAFDVLWAAEVLDRRASLPGEVGPERPEGLVTLTMAGWMADTWRGDLAVGQRWTAAV